MASAWVGSADSNLPDSTICEVVGLNKEAELPLAFCRTNHVQPCRMGIFFAGGGVAGLAISPSDHEEFRSRAVKFFPSPGPERWDVAVAAIELERQGAPPYVIASHAVAVVDTGTEVRSAGLPGSGDQERCPGKPSGVWRPQ